MKRFSHLLFLLIGCALLTTGSPVYAQNIEINTPAVTAIREAMRTRFQQIKPHVVSGAVGITHDGKLEIRDANLIPLAQRGNVNALIAANNQDASALYREIAAANGKPEWEGDIRNTFAQRWVEKSQPGWYIKGADGQWKQK